MPVIEEPHATIRLEREKCPQKSANEGHQATENWDGARDDVGDDDGAGRTAKPCQVVNECVLRDVLGAAKDTEKDVLGRQLQARQWWYVQKVLLLLTCDNKMVLTQRPGSARP